METITPTWTLGDRLNKARTTAGLDQREMCRLLEIGLRSLIRYEHDQHRPSAAILIAWAHFTNVDLAWILGPEQLQAPAMEPLSKPKAPKGRRVTGAPTKRPIRREHDRPSIFPGQRHLVLAEAA